MTDAADSHPLDRVIWNALTGRQKGFALGDDVARRYPAAIGPFGAVANEQAESYRSLLSLVPPRGQLALFTCDEVTPPPEFRVVKRDLVDQMVLEKEPAISAFSKRTVIDLTAADKPEILALVDLTKPGPFGPRTIELGRYLGVRVDGKLVAMSGERMKIDGYTEISAVCVHPESRGQNLAAELIVAIARPIFASGEIPFLHVFASNAPAIKLYRKLDFVVRRRMHLAVVQAL